MSIYIGLGKYSNNGAEGQLMVLQTEEQLWKSLQKV